MIIINDNFCIFVILQSPDKLWNTCLYVYIRHILINPKRTRTHRKPTPLQAVTKYDIHSRNLTTGPSGRDPGQNSRPQVHYDLDKSCIYAGSPGIPVWFITRSQPRRTECRIIWSATDRPSATTVKRRGKDSRALTPCGRGREKEGGSVLSFSTSCLCAPFFGAPDKRHRKVRCHFFGHGARHRNASHANEIQAQWSKSVKLGGAGQLHGRPVPSSVRDFRPNSGRPETTTAAALYLAPCGAGPKSQGSYPRPDIGLPL